MSSLKFVFASDSFKGSLSSEATSRLLSIAAREAFPGCSCVSVPMADGGEGTVDALVAACAGEIVETQVSDPLGRPVAARYGLLGEGRAVIEMAAASGLPLLADAERDPLRTSSYGTGELIADALNRGCTNITIALGGSATNDGGCGMLRALGVRFLDAEGCELAGCGADLARVASLDLTSFDPRVSATSFTAMCDVNNPLTGALGATFTFGPQKGASYAALDQLESGMRNYARVLQDALGLDLSDIPGAGAAGGLGAACLGFLGANLQSGIARVLELTAFDELLEDADLCVTGEGLLDGQTARGKVVSGVASACAAHGVPCVAIAGGVATGAERLPGLTAAVPLPCAPMPLSESVARAEELYLMAARRTFSLLRAGMSLA